MSEPTYEYPLSAIEKRNEETKQLKADLARVTQERDEARELYAQACDVEKTLQRFLDQADRERDQVRADAAALRAAVGKAMSCYCGAEDCVALAQARVALDCPNPGAELLADLRKAKTDAEQIAKWADVFAPTIAAQARAVVAALARWVTP